MYKYFGLGLAVLNAANGAIVITDQRVWIHFNIFAVRPRASLAPGYGFQTISSVMAWI